jgi:predicted ATPase
MSGYKSKKIWVIADVDDIAKDKAKALAKLDKKKIGHWLTDLILNRNSQSGLHILDQRNSSKDITKIMNYLEMIHVEINELHRQLATFSSKFPPLEKKTFFDKFLK